MEFHDGNNLRLLPREKVPENSWVIPGTSTTAFAILGKGGREVRRWHGLKSRAMVRLKPASQSTLNPK
jgi:hypothetical protein